MNKLHALALLMLCSTSGCFIGNTSTTPARYCARQAREIEIQQSVIERDDKVRAAPGVIDVLARYTAGSRIIDVREKMTARGCSI